MPARGSRSEVEVGISDSSSLAFVGKSSQFEVRWARDSLSGARRVADDTIQSFQGRGIAIPVSETSSVEMASPGGLQEHWC